MIFILGVIFLSLGSFSSLIIFRYKLIEKDFSFLLYPRSTCYHCNNRISLHNLIPIIGFIISQGKCKFCSQKISLLYPALEMLHLIVGFTIYYTVTSMAAFVYWYLISSILLVLFFIDYRYFTLPLYLNVSLLLMGILGIYLGNVTLFNGIAGFIFGFIFLWIINAVFKYFKNKDGIGFGDIILLGNLGLIYGYISVPIIVLLGSMVCIIFYIIDKRFKDGVLPFGSGLVIGVFFYQILLNFFEQTLS